MANLTIRGLDDTTHARLRMQAARHGRSMEAEVRAILSEQLAPDSSSRPLGSRIRERFTGLGGEELELPTRQDAPRSAVFE
ncbi:FitA-like ribbon-helix-helix domain-containing protein [Streptomyces acidiscabies]|uniref:Plasmid stabilization protein n=1 Tax=Streptomyces acidiscabies TaxID=42234 RepID=A0A0L0K0A6_9ACTN|nr:plasmid stabilization protein [Streptomyces acidiscabies]MBP5938518.1 plasmid stabilization protein [Streptomyces sp. LBUM 1476]KND31502.1 plasmid stabilization protein [Streptomyces acidiscabies]MBZ3909628.1 plasmid stabilization protein [Streptomyces acidiscabies]MDX2962203.1 plasmid stabilization protein [Streptomyces acidiscabies]MDX3019655.1 plasmid stabilization protein [Streptomyces acidiscabies]